MPKFDLPSQFSMSEIIQIFFSLRNTNYQFRSTFFNLSGTFFGCTNHGLLLRNPWIITTFLRYFINSEGHKFLEILKKSEIPNQNSEFKTKIDSLINSNLIINETFQFRFFLSKRNVFFKFSA